MGLFKKRSSDPEELEQLRAEIATMADRLNAADDAKTRLQNEVHGLATRLETPIPPPPTEHPPPTEPPPPVAPSIDPAELDKLHAKFDRLSHRIDEVDVQSAGDTGPLDPEQLAELRARIDEFSHRLDSNDANPTIDPVQIGQIQARIDEFSHRLDSNDANPAIDPEHVERLDKTMSELGHRIDELDGRITAISTELANQITELGADPVADARDIVPAATELVEELRDAQERLAGEQARYQIAFRQDLAALADRLNGS